MATNEIGATRHGVGNFRENVREDSAPPGMPLHGSPSSRLPPETGKTAQCGTHIRSYRQSRSSLCSFSEIDTRNTKNAVTNYCVCECVLIVRRILELKELISRRPAIPTGLHESERIPPTPLPSSSYPSYNRGVETGHRLHGSRTCRPISGE